MKKPQIIYRGISWLGVTMCYVDSGVWIRFSRWKEQGYWLMWSVNKRFGERFGIEKPIWQLGKGVRWRIACFFLESPSWYKHPRK